MTSGHLRWHRNQSQCPFQNGHENEFQSNQRRGVIPGRCFTFIQMVHMRMLLYADSFISQTALMRKRISTQTKQTQNLLHTGAFTLKFLHAESVYPHKFAYTQKLLHTESFVDKTLSRKGSFTQMAFTHNSQ